MNQIDRIKILMYCEKLQYIVLKGYKLRSKK